jgi:hypothetical protein
LTNYPHWVYILSAGIYRREIEDDRDTSKADLL